MVGTPIPTGHRMKQRKWSQGGGSRTGDCGGIAGPYSCQLRVMAHGFLPNLGSLLMFTCSRLASLSVLSLVLAAGLGGNASAQDAMNGSAAKPAPTLTVGSAAPEFKVEKFLKGAPFSGFEKGKIYVVEFWATWCGPCIASMPHISELQRAFADKGVTIVGVNIWEDREYNDATMGKAVEFVAKMGDKMAYTVAYDGAARFMDTNWMKAAGQNGIPSAFLVDGTGTIAWIGHPGMGELDLVLDEVTGGTWDAVEGPKRLKAGNQAFFDAASAYGRGLAEGEKAWAEALATYPKLGKGREDEKFAAMVAGKHYPEAYALGNQIIDDAVKNKKPDEISSLLNTLLRGRAKPEVLDKPFVTRAAEVSFGMSDQSAVGTHVMLAAAYYAVGENDKAKAAGDKALAIIEPERREGLINYLGTLRDSAPK